MSTLLQQLRNTSQETRNRAVLQEVQRFADHVTNAFLINISPECGGRTIKERALAEAQSSVTNGVTLFQTKAIHLKLGIEDFREIVTKAIRDLVNEKEPETASLIDVEVIMHPAIGIERFGGPAINFGNFPHVIVSAKW